jgi:hypothetical protein
MAHPSGQVKINVVPRMKIETVSIILSVCDKERYGISLPIINIYNIIEASTGANILPKL